MSESYCFSHVIVGLVEDAGTAVWRSTYAKMAVLVKTEDTVLDLHLRPEKLFIMMSQDNRKDKDRAAH